MTVLLRDKQRSRVYQWEDQLLHNNTSLNDLTTPDDLHRAFNRLSELFGIPSELKILPDNTRQTQSFQLGSQVTLIPSHRTFPVLCHEFAHLVIWHYMLQQGQPIALHGEYWLTLYMILLAKTCRFSTETLIQSATSNKLHFHPNLVREHGTRDQAIPKSLQN